MGDERRKVRQWLETDAALGAAEVPFPRRRKVAAKSGVARVNATPVARGAGVIARPPVVEVGQVTEHRREASATTTAGAPVAKTRSVVEMPGIPGGDIGKLPVLTGEEKLARMAKLEGEVIAALTPHLNDVATKIVFGEGDVDAPVVFVGEGPGIEEDKIGRPFVGRSGVMLDKWIAGMGFKREQVYIANVVKLRAASWDETAGRLKDRPPTPEEVARSIHILHAQIEIVRPRAIVTVGAPAVKWLTGTTEGLMKLRGNWMSYRGVPLMPTYHPAFLLRSYTDENRGKVWSDLKAVVAKLKEL